MILLVKLLNVILAGLVAGVLFGVWIGFNPKTLSAQTYVEQQQAAIRALNTLMPVLGLITIILTLIAAFAQKADRPVFYTLLLAALLFIAGGLITKFGNQPINSIVMTWTKTAPPPDWASLRDKWWSFHIMRAVVTIVSFCLIAWANMRKS